MLVKGLHLSNVMKKNKRCSKRLENNAYKVKEMTIKKKLILLQELAEHFRTYTFAHWSPNKN